MLGAQRVVQPDSWSGHSSSAGVKRKQLGDPLGSPGGGEGLEFGRVRPNVLLDGHLSVALGKVLTRYTTSKTSFTPLWSRSQTKCRGFRQMGRGRRGKRDHKSSFLSPGSVVGCALANPFVDGNSKTRDK